MKIVKAATTLVLISLTLSQAHADIRDLIEENQNPTAVVVPVPKGDGVGQSEDGYGLLLEAQDRLDQRLGLTNPSKLENEHFTVVEDQSEEALPVSDFDGRNVLFHLETARRYYEKLVQESGVVDPALDHHAVIRVRTDQAYNLVLHYSEYSDYNNSRYIPTNYQGKWGREIWFDKQKQELHNMDWYGLIVSAGMSATSGNWIGLGANSALGLMTHYNGGIDGAKIPSVIYHEAFHWASDTDGYFPMASEGNPVAEDYANYFGSSILNRPEMAMIDAYSSRYYKHKYKKIREVKDTNPTSYNASSFGPSVFWQIRNWLGQDRADLLIWNSLHFLNGSFRESDVPRAVLAAAQNMPSITESEYSKISGLFQKYAQSYINLDIKAGVLKASDATPKSLAQLVADMDDSALRDAGLKQAESIRQMPDLLKAEGVTLTLEDERQFAELADRLAIEANQPEFKSKIVRTLHHVGHGFKRAGIDVLKGFGLVGSAIYSISAAPLAFGADFMTGLLFGHGLISGNQKNGIGKQVVGGAAGVASFYYAYTGLTALGYTISAPVNITSLGVVTINGLICAHANASGTGERDRYCTHNAKLMQTITLDTAKAGAVVGEDIRHAIIRVAHFIVKTAKNIVD